MKTYYPKTSILFFLFFSISQIFAQHKNNISTNVGLLQMKEGFNYGLVFSGLKIGVQYQHKWILPNFEINYQPRLALATAFSKGMVALNIHFAPIDISFVKPIYKQTSHTLKIGGNISTNYNYQVYPDLHSGHLFWFGEIGLSPVLEYAYRWKNKKISLTFQNSVVGFVSHTETNNPYFYSLKFSDFITRPNSNLKFGSFDKYNHSHFTFEFTPNTEKRHSFAIAVEYMGVWYNTHFQSLNYYLQWKKSF